MALNEGPLCVYAMLRDGISHFKGMCSASMCSMTEFGRRQCRSVWEVELYLWNCYIGHFSEFWPIRATELEVMETEP
jgi:hypothetical protein